MKREVTTHPAGVQYRAQSVPETGYVSDWKNAFSRNKTNIEKQTEKGKDKDAEEDVSLRFFNTRTISFALHRMENRQDFERMAFVIKACANEAAQEFKTVLHVERMRTGSRLIACDGQRMHVAEISKKIKSGEYKVFASKETIALGEPLAGVKFPNWAKIIPDNARKRGVINLEDSGLGKNMEQTERMSIAFNTFVKQSGEPVNLRYLEDLTKKVWSIHCQSEKHRPILLKEEGTEKGVYAVIAPIRLEAAPSAKAA
jgi:hypothetical protein